MTTPDVAWFHGEKKHFEGKRGERDCKKDSDVLDSIVSAFESWNMPMREKLSNPILFQRRQLLGYLLANFEIYRMIERVKGSAFYFGAYHGSDMLSWANIFAALEPYNHTREIIAFDTWEGNTEPSPQDCTHGGSFHTLVKGGWKSESRTFLEEMVRIYDLNRPLSHIPKIHLVQGDICETLPDWLQMRKHTIASLIVLTVNLYAPTKVALELMWPLMSPGAVIVIRSLNEEYYPGCMQAVRDVLGNPRIEAFPWAPNLAYIRKP